LSRPDLGTVLVENDRLTLLTSMYEAATSECFSFVRAIKMSQNTDHHSNKKPPGASIAGKEIHSFSDRKFTMSQVDI
jgi:hypothetical protein